MWTKYYWTPHWIKESCCNSLPTFIYQTLYKIVSFCWWTLRSTLLLTARLFWHITWILQSSLILCLRFESSQSGLNGSRKFLLKLFDHCPKLIAKHANQTPWCPRPKWLGGCSLGTQRDTTKPTQQMKNDSELKRTNRGRNSTLATHTGPVRELHWIRPVSTTLENLLN